MDAPKNIIFPAFKGRLHLVHKADCQSERPSNVLLMTQLRRSAQKLNPGMDPEELAALVQKQAQERKAATGREMIKEGFAELTEAITFAEACRWLEMFVEAQSHKGFES